MPKKYYNVTIQEVTVTEVDGRSRNDYNKLYEQNTEKLDVQMLILAVNEQWGAIKYRLGEPRV